MVCLGHTRVLWVSVDPEVCSLAPLCTFVERDQAGGGGLPGRWALLGPGRDLGGLTWLADKHLWVTT